MKIKAIIKISIALLFLQLVPLLISFFSPEFKLALITESFGNTPSQDAVKMFELFSLVVGLMGIGICLLMYGVLTFTDLMVLRRLSFLFFMLMGFFALPDLIGAIKGNQTAPLPVIILNLIMIVLLLYGSKRGTA